MLKLRRCLMAALIVGLTTIGGASGWPNAAARAQGLFDTPKYAAIVVDARTGEVLYGRHADDPRYLASVTKIMTLYLTFEALATGRLSPNDPVVVSEHAALQGPTKLGLRAGSTITVDNAIRAAAVLSANDMAVALAEKVGGSEDRFAQLMNMRARELGMMHSRFINANGLPRGRDGNISTARDVAILSRSVMRDYPQYYSYFGQREFDYGRRVVYNHNRLLLKMPGVDGLKTGYTNAAGFNLAASAVRDGRRLITVVLGGSSTAARDDNVETLLTAGFDVLSRRARGQAITIAQNIAEPDDVGGPVTRPSIEQGSGDQRQIAVEVADLGQPVSGRPAAASVYARPPQQLAYARPPVALAVAAPAPVAVAAAPPPRTTPVTPVPRPTLLAAVGSSVVLPAADCAHSRRPVSCRVQVAAATPDCGKLHGRRKRACERATPRATEVQVAQASANTPLDCLHLRGSRRRTCEAAAPAQVAQASSPDCGKLHGRRRRTCEVIVAPVQVAQAAALDCAKIHGRRHRACEAAASPAPVQVAQATAPDCGKLHGRRRQACDKDTVQVATAESHEDRGGRYVIQVGAYNSLHQAQDQLNSVLQRYAGAVASASGKVMGAAGTYRVRFTGMTQASAKSACRTLSHKGERCMVMAAG